MPSWAVVATGDRAAGTDVVRSMAEHAGAHITEVEGSHVIMISQPDAVTGVILEAIAAVGAPVGTAEADVSTGTSPTPSSSRAGEFGPVRQVEAGLLDVGYVDAGPADGRAVLLLHGWPYDIHSFADVTPMLVPHGYRVIVPHLRGYGSTRFLSDETLRNGEQAALAADAIALMDALDVDRAVVGGFDWGARTANIMAALWPQRCTALVSVSGYLIGSQAAGKQPLPPEAELQWWYQYYFATERGGRAMPRNRREFGRLIWRTASPQWDFDDATFDRTAASFDNPDHVDIVIHNYRWRLGLADGEPGYCDAESRLAEAPDITVPTITLEGDANGAPHPEPAAMRRSSQGRTRTARSEEASGTTCLRKHPRRSRMQSSSSAAGDESLGSAAGRESASPVRGHGRLAQLPRRRRMLSDPGDSRLVSRTYAAKEDRSC